MYYVFIENDKINGKGECICETDGIQSIEVSEEIYENLDRYIWNGSEIVENPNYEKEHYEELWNEVDKAREQYRAEHIDPRTNARTRKTANGTWTEKDEQDYLALDAEVTAWIEENLPYPEE